MTDRMSTFVWGLAGALLVAFVVFTVGVDQFSEGVVQFTLMALLLVFAFVAFATILRRVRGGEVLHADRAATIGEPGPAHFLFHDLRSAPLWLVVRLYVGFAWLEAGFHKVTDPKWGYGDGTGLLGYWKGAVAIPQTGTPKISYDWYRDFLNFLIGNNAHTWFAPLIAYGEILVGLGLLFGVLTGWAAFFGMLMNMSFMLAGSASTNPVLFALSVLLILAWRVAGYLGGDRYALPLLGVPGLGRPASDTWGGAVREQPQLAGD
jgi:thiosulfate dehydrogenase [quinone] large subunit